MADMITTCPLAKKKPCCCRLLHHHQPTAAQLANFGLPMCTWSLLVLQKRPKFHLLVLLSTTKSNGPFPCFCFLFCCCFSKKNPFSPWYFQTSKVFPHCFFETSRHPSRLEPRRFRRTLGIFGVVQDANLTLWLRTLVELLEGFEKRWPLGCPRNLG